jgi:hypothetical protein
MRSFRVEYKYRAGNSLLISRDAEGIVREGEANVRGIECGDTGSDDTLLCVWRNYSFAVHVYGLCDL